MLENNKKQAAGYDDVSCSHIKEIKMESKNIKIDFVEKGWIYY